MKKIKYKVKSFNDSLADVVIFCENDAVLEGNIHIAKRDSYNGEYTIEDEEGETIWQC